MADLKTFLLARLDEDEAAIKRRDMRLPIHFVGCWYYSNSLDIYTECDCDEDGEASKKALAELQTKRTLIASFIGSEQEFIVALLVAPYAEHPDYVSSLA